MAFTTEPIFRLTVEQYHALIRSGELTDEDPVELIEGILVYKMPKNTPHATGTRLCRRAIETLLPQGWFCDSQEPLTLPDGEPEPDGMIVRGKIEDYTQKHPGPRDVALVLEVADSSIDRDRGIKLWSYARAGVPVYWVLDVEGQALHVYSDADPDSSPHPSYRKYERFAGDQKVTIVLDDKSCGEITVANVMPPQEHADGRGV